jgi:copper(I)-binding protein
MRLFIAALAVLGLAACSPSQPPPARSAGLRIEAAWASPTPGGVTVSAGYMTIVNDGDAGDALLAASSPRAASVEVHTMSMEGAVMQMRPAGPLPIPARQSVTLAPNGLHLMFMGVTQPFAEGEEIPVRLSFEHAGAVDVSLPVRRQAPAADDMDDMH